MRTVSRPGTAARLPVARLRPSHALAGTVPASPNIRVSPKNLRRPPPCDRRPIGEGYAPHGPGGDRTIVHDGAGPCPRVVQTTRARPKPGPLPRGDGPATTGCRGPTTCPGPRA